MIVHSYLVIPAQETAKTHEQMQFSQKNATNGRDNYVCTDCGCYSCGRIYSSTCTVCGGISTDPPQRIRSRYLCVECARRYPTCICNKQSAIWPPTSFNFRDPPKYCWCGC
ncbi:unnamed protein product, partial [Rotaria magnacalcarata]